MTDKPKSSSKAKKERTFPIRNFANLFDEFTEANAVFKDKPWSVDDLRDAIDRALIKHYKR